MKYLSFLDISFENIRFAVLDLELKKIVYVKNIKGEINIKREIEIKATNPIFKQFIIILNEAEEHLKSILIDVVVLIRTKKLKVYKIDFERELHEYKRIDDNYVKKFNRDIFTYLKEKHNKTDVILNLIPIRYVIDSKIEFKNERIFGKKISSTFLYTELNRFAVDSFVEKFENFKLRIDSFVSSDYCYILNNFDKENLLFLDIGSYFTSYCIYSKSLNKIIRNSFNVGSFDVSNDIAKTFDISFQEAEYLKLNLDLMIIKDENHHFHLNNFQEVKVVNVIRIVEARVKEILDMVKKDLILKQIPNIDTIHISLKNFQSQILKNLIFEKFTIHPVPVSIDFVNSDDFENFNYLDFGNLFIVIEFYLKNLNKINSFKKIEKDGINFQKISCFLKRIFY